MDKTNYRQLSFKKVMFSMGIIMLFWALFWYPFYYFVFPENLNVLVSNFIGISREYIRMLPAIFFLIYYKNALKTSFQEIFSLKFNYKWFLTFLVLVMADLCLVSYLTNGKVYFNSNKMQFFDVILLLSLGLCQELVFRGWSFNAFQTVTSQKNAVILSSVFFSASHWFAHFLKFYTGTFNLPSFIQVTIFTFIFGIVMCFILIKTKNKSIIPLAILHAVWDLCADAIY